MSQLSRAKRVRRLLPLAALGGVALGGLGAGAARAATTDPGPGGGIHIPVAPGVVGHINLDIHPCIDVAVGDGHAPGVPPDPIKVHVDPSRLGLPRINLNINPCI